LSQNISFQRELELARGCGQLLLDGGWHPGRTGAFERTSEPLSCARDRACWILAMFLGIDLGHETRSVWRKKVRAAVRRLL
jgi:hypothetical protein